MSTPPIVAPHSGAHEDDRTSLGKDALRRAFLDNLFYVQGKFSALATKHDYYMALDCQARVSAAYGEPEHWTRMSILNVARMGKFSSDRSIREYCQAVWRVVPVKIALLTPDQAGADLLQ